MGRITRSARMQPCSVRLPTGCASSETTVFAHAPSVSKGIGYKSPDWWGAYACDRCHSILDGRISHNLTELELAQGWLRGIHETQRKLVAEGLITLK